MLSLLGRRAGFLGWTRELHYHVVASRTAGMFLGWAKDLFSSAVAFEDLAGGMAPLLFLGSSLGPHVKRT